jgi:hypothetical protein
MEDEIEAVSDEEEQEVSEEERDETFNVDENQCHLCRIKMRSKDEVYYHVQENHKEYFRGMMEIVENRSCFNMNLGVS